jgi:hypothetical protein
MFLACLEIADSLPSGNGWPNETTVLESVRRAEVAPRTVACWLCQLMHSGVVASRPRSSGYLKG